MKTTSPDSIPIALTRQAHLYAAKFAAQQINPRKGKQVYLNTLAVCAVHTYLQWLAIETSLDQADCWHSGMRSLFNVADLVLPNLGKLECCPILPEQERLTIALDTLDDRIGYVAVQFDHSLEQVHLSGFLSAKAVTPSKNSVSVAQFQSLDILLNTIDWRQQCTNLRQWFNQVFVDEWQPVTTLLAPSVAALRSVNPTTDAESNQHIASRGKVLTLKQGEQLESVILVVKMTESENEEVDLRLQLYPEPNREYLPQGLRVSIYDEADKLCMEAQTGQTDDGIQLEFSCLPQESFRLDLTLGDIHLSEQFVV